MTFEIGLLLAVIAIAMVLFSIERLPADVTALGVLLTLVLSGLLPAEQAFAGFGSETFIMILGLLILTAALMNTGVVDLASGLILRHVSDSPARLQYLVTSAGALLSAFMSNTGATAFFLPIAISLGRRLAVPASRMLLPLAFGSILASSVTLIGTSTNLVISGLIVDYGLAPIGMFELTTVGLPILLVGLVYMFTLGQRLIPERPYDPGSAEDFGLQAYLTEILILPGSSLDGRLMAESGLSKMLDLTVLRVLRDGKKHLVPDADLRLQADDRLLVEGKRDEISKVRQILGLELKPKVEIARAELESENVGLFEVIVLPRSPFIGRTLEYLNFRERYGLQVLGINRSGHTTRTRLSRMRISTGDQLLVQGNRANVKVLDEENAFRLVRPVHQETPDEGRAPWAVAIFAGVLALAALNVLTLPVAVILGVLLVFVTRTITPEEAYRQVEWRALVLIASMLAVGAAMEATGAASYLAGLIASLAGGQPPVWLLAGFFGLTMLLTQPMSNQAAAVVVVPVAIETAMRLGLNPRAFAMMIAVGASCSFLTPLEPACLMVFGPGNYRFLDFLKVGAPLTVLVFLVAILLVPLLWPL